MGFLSLNLVTQVKPTLVESTVGAAPRERPAALHIASISVVTESCRAPVKEQRCAETDPQQGSTMPHSKGKLATGAGWTPEPYRSVTALLFLLFD
jgi:hypothetical protein